MSELKKDILILGEGGAGANIVRELIKSSDDDYNCAMIVASNAERNKISDIENDLEGIVQLNIDGTGKDPTLGYNACDDKAEEIDELINDYGFIFHVLGFAGGTGVGTAFYIGENYPADEGVKYHYYIGAMPEFRENLDILENALQAITTLDKYGRVWPIDNRLRDNKLLYSEINKKIVEEITYIINLPNLKTVTKDMDSTNVLKVLFPEDFEHRGIFTFKRFEIPGFKENIPFNKLDEYNKSISLKLDFDLFSAYGYILNLNDLEKVNYAEKYKDKFEKWLEEQMPGASTTHDTISLNDEGKNEIILFMSGPVLSKEQLNDYLEKINSLSEEKDKKLSELEQKEFTYNRKNNNKINLKSKKKPNPFKKKNDDNNKGNPFKNKKKNGSLMDLLGK